MKKIATRVLSVVFAAILIVVPVVVIAQQSGYAPIVVTESNGTSYTQLATIVPINTDYLADNGYILSTGLDTRVTSSGVDIPHMLADDKVMFSTSYIGDELKTLLFESNETPLSGFYIIPGYDGYITTSDAAALELGNNFEIGFDGYVDTSSGSDKILVNKYGAFQIYVSATEEITSVVYTASASESPYSSSSDGYTTGADTVYSTTHNALSGSVSDGSDFVRVGQKYTTPTYTIYRQFVFFDTSPIPDDAFIISVILKLWGQGDDSDTDFLLTIQNGQPTYPSDPLVSTDYNYTYYSGDGGSLTTVGWNTGGYNDITLNADGRSWINLTGITKLALRSNRDINSNTPTGDEYVMVYHSEHAGTDNDPQLVVTYATPVAAVTATGISSGDYPVRVTAENVVKNQGFESGDPPDDWSVSNAIFSRDNGTVHDGTYSGKIISNGVYSGITQSLDDYAAYRGKTITFGVWVWNSSSNDRSQRLQIFDGVGTSNSSNFAKNDTWTWVELSRTVDVNATTLIIRMRVNNSGVSDTDDYMYVDNAQVWMLEIYIDGTLEDLEGLGGVGVPDNDNDWIWMQNNVMPYAGYITLAVSSIEILRYLPVDIIIGTKLLDETVDSGTADSGSTTTLVDNILTEANDYWNNLILEILTTTDGLAPQGEVATITDFIAASDELQFDALTAAVESGDTYELRSDGVITWGSNPAGISVAVGAWVFETPQTLGEPVLITPDVVQEQNPPSEMFTPTGPNNPIDDAFDTLETTIASVLGEGNLLASQMWLALWLIATIVIMVLILQKLQNQMMAAGALLFMTGFGVALGIMPWWPLIPTLIMCLAILAWEREPTVS